MGKKSDGPIEPGKRDKKAAKDTTIQMQKCRGCGVYVPASGGICNCRN